MRKIVVEVGFDWTAGNIAPALEDEHGPILRDRNYQLYPLQLGFVRLDGSQGFPIWPTQLEERDEIRFKIFDIDRRPRAKGEIGAQPLLFHAYFQNPEEPLESRQLFTGQPTPIEASRHGSDTTPCRIESAIGVTPSHYFGAPEKARGTVRNFQAWDVLGDEGHQLICQLAPKRPGRQLDCALMALALRVRRGREVRDFAVDPEIYVGPYVNDPPPSQSQRAASIRNRR